MNRKDAAKFYKAILENPGITAEVLIENLYAARGKTNEEIDKILAEYNAIISEAESQGLKGWDVYNYLTTPRDKVEYINKDNNGNEIKIEVEGDPKFDPSGKTDLTPATGSPDFQFGDESVNKPAAPSTGTPNIDFPNSSNNLNPTSDKGPQAPSVDFPNSSNGVSQGTQSPNIDFPNSSNGINPGTQSPDEGPKFGGF